MTTEARYEVTTFDVCASGFERLRSYSEFILLASISPETTAKELREQFLDDVDSCGRPDDFDYEAVRQCVELYFMRHLNDLFANRANPFNLESGRTDIGLDESEYEGEGCSAILYIRDNKEGAHFPVY